MSATTTLAPSPASLGRADHSRFPAIEEFHTIDNLLRSHATENDQKPLICYPVHTASDFEEHTAVDIDRYVDIAAGYYVRHGLAAAVSIDSVDGMLCMCMGADVQCVRTRHWRKHPR